MKASLNSVSQKIRRSGKYIALFFAALLVLLSVVFWTPIKNQLNDWKLLPQPERFSELYFTDHQHLPTTYAAGQTQTVKFTVHSLEHQPKSYTYAITASQTVGDPKAQILATGNFTLQHDQYRKETREITIPDLGPRINIRVTLSPTQSIHYWLTQIAAPVAVAPAEEGQE
jgi:hypothetical protein